MAVKKETIKVLLTEEEIKARVSELAEQINVDYQDKEIVAICILKGSVVFFADLIRELDIPVHCDFMGVSSYGKEMTSSGEVKVTLDINEPLSGKNVIIVEDIVDSGITLNYLVQTIRSRNPHSIRVCSLLVKPECIKIPVEVDYVGFNIENHFVIGYGVDHAERYRELPYIGYVVKEH